MKKIISALALFAPVAAFAQSTTDTFGATSATSAVSGQITLVGGLMVSIAGLWLAYRWVRRAMAR